MHRFKSEEFYKPGFRKLRASDAPICFSRTVKS